MDMKDTPVKHLLKNSFIDKEHNARRWLGRFALPGDRHNVSLELLSGGEKTKVCLATIASNEPSVLLLDEPTNHLDIETVEALIDALCKFKGAVVMVTHNQELIRRVADVVYEMRYGELNLLDIDILEHKKRLMRNM